MNQWKREVALNFRRIVLTLLMFTVTACSDSAPSGATQSNHSPAVSDGDVAAPMRSDVNVSAEPVQEPGIGGAADLPAVDTPATGDKEVGLSNDGEVVSADPGQAEPTAPVTTEQTAPEEATGDIPQTHIIKGVVTQWRPLVLFANVGDTIVFRQMAGHDTETIPELIPAGASGWKSKLGAEGYSVTLDAAGAYVYKCNPHASSGMIGVIVAGELPPANLQELTDSPLNKGMVARTLRKFKQALDAR